MKRPVSELTQKDHIEEAIQNWYEHAKKRVATGKQVPTIFQAIVRLLDENKRLNRRVEMLEDDYRSAQDEIEDIKKHMTGALFSLR